VTRNDLTGHLACTATAPVRNPKSAGKPAVFDFYWKALPTGLVRKSPARAGLTAANVSVCITDEGLPDPTADLLALQASNDATGGTDAIFLRG
jgi:hypothetical protein